MGFSIYDLLREVEGDENQDAGAEAPAEPTAGDVPAEDNNAGNEDDFDIDADLDDEDADNPDDTGDEGGDDDFADDTGADNTSSSNSDDSEDEPVESNTDIFASLTAEEQKIKIMELKNMYSDLYNAIDDLLEKIGLLDADEDSIVFISRITNILTDLKQYIVDYLLYEFNVKSYIENDIMFNRFLTIIQSVSLAFDKYQKKLAKNDNVSNENTEHNGKK